ncbi:MAG: hypothetical protein JSU90_02515 [Nitrospiraceae bacterium]|nr:MAG: hypothetical protein JSU90_02515 [Nitrospiraceae bacterium]
MIKKSMLFIMLLLCIVPGADACVGKTLNIGVRDSVEDRLLAEMLSTLVQERTGTTINIKYFKKDQDIYEAVKVKEVDISIENTTRAMRLLNQSADVDVQMAYELVKTSYEKEKGLIWLKPFGFLNGNGPGGPSYTATVLRVEVLSNYPALPRLFNKLGSAINDESYTKLINSVQSGREPSDVARDFLKGQKLI